jgi:hypothetical protein
MQFYFVSIRINSVNVKGLIYGGICPANKTVKQGGDLKEIDVWTKLIRMSAQQAMSISTRTGIQRQEIIAEHHKKFRHESKAENKR